jgi:surface polysaccharide O-acyltransferase-like enzyme
MRASEVGTQTSPRTSLQVAAPSKTTRTSAARADAGERQRHIFVDNIRFWSILSIIAVHCAYVVTESGSQTRALREILSAPWKFGTIGFFLISGFLLGEGLERRPPREYLVRRLRRLFVPWLFWYGIAVVVLLVEDVLHHRAQLSLHLAGHEAVYCFFDTAYWFVPNMLFALCILLLFRRHFHDPRFFAALVGINLFYAVNVYTRWIPSKHTTAVFGFILYLWLGNYAARHHARLQRWIAQCPAWKLAALTVLTGSIAFGEGRLLNRLHAPDPLNGMRLSAQIFSVVAALMLFKFRAPTFPRFINVRAHTFGVYLIHPIVLIIWVEWIRVILDRFPQNDRMATLVLRLTLWFFSAALVCVLCFAATRVLAQSARLAWMVGVRREPLPRGHLNPSSHPVPLGQSEPG